MTLPLSGVKVVDFTRALAGPYCTMLLGDLGADVTKIELLPDGDMTRAWGPFKDGHSLYFISTNRNKRSVALNLRSTAGKTAAQHLARSADVVIENFRPGVMDALDLGQQSLHEHRPGLVYCSISGYGPVGPASDWAGFDQIAQGMGGLMSVTGERGARPLRVGIPIADILAGMFAAIGVLAKLATTSAADRGGTVTTSLLESVLAVMVFQAQRALSLNEVAGPVGNDHPLLCPYGTFDCKDGPLNVAVGTDPMWRILCSVLGQSALADDPEFATNEGRLANRAKVTRILSEIFVGRSVAEWVEELAAAGVPCGPILDLGAATTHPQVRELGLVQVVDHSALGELPVLRAPLWLDGKAAGVTLAPPVLGQHTRSELLRTGLSENEVDSMIAAGDAFEAAST